MRTSLLNIASCLACTALVLAQKPHLPVTPLFPISENNKIGYIDKEGKVILPAIYPGGGEFSEGLAPVRLKGRYGFIDGTGRFVISPKFDWAESFVNGLAIVYEEGHPYYIDHTGNSPFPCNYSAISSFSHGLARVRSASGRMGLIDQGGQLVVDTLYSKIGDLCDGLYVVEIRNSKGKWKSGVIDTMGLVIVRPGTYTDIKDFKDGYAVVELKTDVTGLIDRKGRLLFSRPYKNRVYVDANAFGNGIGTINLSASGKSYPGFVDTHNQLLLDDSTVKDIRPFSNGRAFVKREDDEYRMIDTRMQVVGTVKFSDVHEPGFINGYAMVKTADGWGFIDTNARFVVKPAYDDIHECGIVNNYFFFRTYKGDSTFYGVATLDGKEICKSYLEDIDRSGFMNGLLKVVIHGKLAFLNTEGKVVWQSKTSYSEKNTTSIHPALSDVNVDYMMRGYFYAYSSPEKTEENIHGGGWAISNNFPKKLSGKRFEENSLSITIDTHTTDTFARSYNGYPVYVANTTTDTCQFHAQDSRLSMQMQALDREGNWKDIDYLPSSWCGNSYHVLSLEPGAYWKFVIPKFEGEIPTKLRIQLEYIDALHPKNDKVIYSNTIDGAINPAQFWNKRRYYPQGIMDPYND